MDTKTEILTITTASGNAYREAHTPATKAATIRNASADRIKVQDRDGVILADGIEGGAEPVEVANRTSGYVMGGCGHRVSVAEWNAGWFTCDHCAAAERANLRAAEAYARVSGAVQTTYNGVTWNRYIMPTTY